MVSPSTQSRYISLGDPLVWAYPAGAGGASLSVSPPIVNTSCVVTIYFTGVGTTWTSTTPVFSPSGVSGVTLGSITYDSDTTAHADLTVGGNTGTLTWTDSSVSTTATQIVQFSGLTVPQVVRLPAIYWTEEWR